MHAVAWYSICNIARRRARKNKLTRLGFCAEAAAARALCIQWSRDTFKFDCKVEKLVP